MALFLFQKNSFSLGTPDHLTTDIPSEFAAPLNFLLIHTGNENILVDAGFGSTLPTAGKLVEQLNILDIYPKDIHKVIITHRHRDHIGGMTENRVPAFPNAQYIIRREEWEQWTQDPSSDQYKKLMPLKGCISFITSDIELVPGIRLVHTPGHIAGHLSLSISSGGQCLLVASDILSHPLALQNLSSHIGAEMSPKLGRETREKFLQDSVNQSALLFVCHYPFPGLGYIVKEELGWKWVPVYSRG